MPEAKPSPQRWVACVDLSVEKRGEDPIQIAAGNECVGVPENWPPKWLVDQGLVEPMRPATKSEGGA